MTKQKIKEPLMNLKVGKEVDFSIGSLASVEVVRARIQTETGRKFTVRQKVVVKRKI